MRPVGDTSKPRVDSPGLGGPAGGHLLLGGPRCTACRAAPDVSSLCRRECLEQPCEASPVCVYMRDEVGPAPPPGPTSPCGPARFPKWKTLPQSHLGGEWAAWLWALTAGVFPASRGTARRPRPLGALFVFSAPPRAPEWFVLINICFAPCFDLFQKQCSVVQAQPGPGPACPRPAARDGDPPGAGTPAHRAFLF